MRVSRSILYPVAVCTLAFAGSAQAQTVDSTAKDSTVKTDSLVATTLSDEQTTRGFAVFTKVCAACHTSEDITGNDFKLKWHSRPVFDLFDIIRTTMPDDAPGTMTRDEYIDVTAYLLRLNGAPAGGMPINNADTTGMRKMKIDITVPPPVLDSLFKMDSTMLKKDTTKVDTARVAYVKTKASSARAKPGTLFAQRKQR